MKRLVRLWIAEGFLKFEKDLEGVAEKCLQDLIDRFLVLVSNKSLDETRVRYCKVHDLIYELCLREAQRQFFFVKNDIVYVDYDGDYNLDKDDDWDEYDNLDEDKYDYVDEGDDADLDDDEDEDEDDDSEAEDEDEEDDLEAEDEDDHLDEDEDYKMLFKNKFRPFKHIMGPFKRQIKDDKSGFGRYTALLTPGHHHLIRRQTDGAGNNLLKRTRSIFFNNSYSELLVSNQSFFISVYWESWT